MKLTKKLEAEILKTYNVYWDAYLAGDMKTFASLLDDNIKVFGTAVSEVFNNKAETVRFYKATAHQMTGKAEFRNRKIKMFAVDETVLIHEQNKLYVLIENEWNFYGPARVSALLVKTPNGWRLAHQHGSFPDSRAEAGEQIAPEKIKKENLELREAIKRRTVELENKNRELEIEASLERVRTIAMTMREPADMLDVCKTISLQLQSLGVKEIRNVQTAIIYASKSIYINYEYYAKHKKQLITEVDFKSHYYQKLFVNNMLKGTGQIFTKTLKGKKVEDWYEHQKTTNQFADSYLAKAKSLSYYWFSLGPLALGISTYSPLSEEELSLFKRFRNVFELAYQRYLDIEQAIAQAREAKIEAALERVRATSMSMHKSEELLNICEVLYHEFSAHGFDSLRNAMINIHNDEKKSFINYDYSDEIGRSINNLVYDIHPLVARQMKKIRSADDAFSETYFTGKDLVNWKKFRKRIGEKEDPRLHQTKGLFYYFYSIGIGSIGISTFGSIDEDQKSLLKRFRNVFALSYQRYMDIAKAEAQTREAKIEAALERVRAASMSMRDSSALSGIIYKLYGELTSLDAKLDRCFIMIVNPENQGITWWMAGQEGLLAENGFFVQMNEHASHLMYLDNCKKRKKKWTYLFEGEEKSDWDRFGFSKTELAKLPEPIKTFMASAKKVYLSGSSDQFGSLVTGSFEPLPDEQQEIISRFSIVFNQAYIRFLDLQRAEAQAREAQIEAALERVRARTMAMQQSDELSNTAAVLFQEIKKISQEELIQLTIGIYNEAAGLIEFRVTSWAGGGEHENRAFNLSIEEPTVIKPAFTAWKQQKKSIVIDLVGEELEGWLKYRNANTGVTVRSADTKGRRVITVAFFSKGHISLSSPLPLSAETIQLLERFAIVFDGTYTRFLDLQKAEEQTKEAEIQLALERVRAKSLAMHKTSELQEVVNEVAQQLLQMKIDMDGGVIIIINDEVDKDVPLWGAAGAAHYVQKAKAPYLDIPIITRMISAIKKRESFLIERYTKDEKDEFMQHLFRYHPWDKLTGERKHELLAREGGYCRSMSISRHTSIAIINHHGREFSDADNKILQRFGNVLEQSYTRFLDLKKAEAQAREAQIETALEKVRSRSLVMQSSNELKEVIAMVFEKLKELNFNMDSRAAIINIYTEGSKEFTEWITDPGQTYPTSFIIPELPFDILSHVWTAREKGADFSSRVIYKEEKNPFFNFLFRNTGYQYLPEEIKKGMLESEYYTYSIAMGKNSGISLPDLSGKLLTDSEIDILKRFAKVFDQAYTRFLDLQKSEAQNKIIQAENERKTRELEEARELQLAMLPKDIPKLKDFEIAVYMKTATEVGGDYYDFSFMHNGSLNIAIGDATGHGMKAGTMVTMIKSLFMVNSSSKEMIEFFKLTNEAIKNSNLRRMMVGFAMMNIYGNKLKVLNAGMPPVYYYKNASCEVVEIGGHNLPLGAMNKSKYTADEIDMNHGDAILMLSDGLPELPNNKNEQYGYKKLVDTFLQAGCRSADEIINVLINEISNWAGNKEHEDDITFVVIKLK